MNYMLLQKLSSAFNSGISCITLLRNRCTCGVTYNDKNTHNIVEKCVTARRFDIYIAAIEA
jgi:hypothetical protein